MSVVYVCVKNLGFGNYTTPTFITPNLNEALLYQAGSRINGFPAIEILTYQLDTVYTEY